MTRSKWANGSDADLLADCHVDTYRASGPGGQKRNKTSSAVRLRHDPSGLIVIAEESRSQHENKAKALKRLRRTLYLILRDPIENVPAETLELVAAMPGGRLDVNPKHPAFWPAVGRLLDLLAVVECQLSTAAEKIGTTTANLSDFLAQDPKVWQEVNRLRVQYGLKSLRTG